MRLRLPFLSLALIIAVAACGKQDPVANGASKITAVPGGSSRPAPTPAGGPPVEATAPAAAAAATSAAAIPAALRGRWGLAPADCTSALGDAKGLLVINAGELRFYESRAVPSPGVESDSNSIGGNFRFTGEGQSWTRFEKFELQGDKLVRTESNPAASYTYAKC
jgi:hypothetical protein